MRKRRMQIRRALFFLLLLFLLLFFLLMGMLFKGCGEKRKRKQELSYRQSGIDLMAQEDYEGAKDAFEQALEQHEGDPTELEEDIWLYLAEAQTASGNLDEAISIYKDLLDGETEKCKLYELLGKAALEKEEYEQAIAWFDEGLSCETVTNKDDLWTGKIAAIEYTGDFQQAKAEMEQYLKEYPTDEHAKRESVFLNTR